MSRHAFCAERVVALSERERTAVPRHRRNCSSKTGVAVLGRPVDNYSRERSGGLVQPSLSSVPKLACPFDRAWYTRHNDWLDHRVPISWEVRKRDRQRGEGWTGGLWSKGQGELLTAAGRTIAAVPPRTQMLPIPLEQLELNETSRLIMTGQFGISIAVAGYSLLSLPGFRVRARRVAEESHAAVTNASGIIPATVGLIRWWTAVLIMAWLPLALAAFVLLVALAEPVFYIERGLYENGSHWFFWIQLTLFLGSWIAASLLTLGSIRLASAEREVNA